MHSRSTRPNRAMVRASCFSSAALTSSFANLVARVYLTQNPLSAVAVPSATPAGR